MMSAPARHHDEFMRCDPLPDAAQNGRDRLDHREIIPAQMRRYGPNSRVAASPTIPAIARGSCGVSAPFVLPPGDGRHIDMGIFSMTVKATAADTDEEFTLLEATEPPRFRASDAHPRSRGLLRPRR